MNTYSDFVDNKSNNWQWTSGELNDYRSNNALTFEGGPILLYVPEVYQVQTQILLEDHSFELYDFDNEGFENVHQNNAGDWIYYNYPDPYPNIYDGQINGIAEIPLLNFDNSLLCFEILYWIYF